MCAQLLLYSNLASLAKLGAGGYPCALTCTGYAGHSGKTAVFSFWFRARLTQSTPELGLAAIHDLTSLRFRKKLLIGLTHRKVGVSAAAGQSIKFLKNYLSRFGSD